MDAIEELLTRGVDTIYPNREALEKVLRSGKKLRLYQGFDPTGAQLHIGHAVALRKLRQFQDLGHEVIFLIGDFTAMIGDPTGKMDSRKMLTKEEVLRNAQSYQDQAARILRFDGENPVTIMYNSTWLEKISALEFIQLSHHLTYQQVVERDMFQKRMNQGQDIYLNEFLYPVMQAYDSVAMNVDLEIGGTDQMFNMMMGRKLMRNMKQKEKIAEIREKMLTGTNPMQYKAQLARTLTAEFNNVDAAKIAEKNFVDVFVNKKQPTMNMLSVMMKRGQENCLAINLVLMTNHTKSKSEARRLIEQRAVEFNNVVVQSPNEMLSIKDGDTIRI